MARPRQGFRPEILRLEDRRLLAAQPVPPNLPSWVGFVANSIPVSQQSGSVTVTLQRTTPGYSAPLQVRVVSDASPAIGVNLQAVDQTVTFTGTEQQIPLTIPITTGAPNSGEVDVTLTMIPLSGPANLMVGQPAVLQIKSGVDAVPPSITGGRLTKQGIELTFSKAMDPATVQDVNNYYVEARVTHNRDTKDILGAVFLGKWTGLRPSVNTTQRVALRAATYDPASRTVTLIGALPAGVTSLTVMSAAQAPRAMGPKRRAQAALAASPLTDTAGNPIGGNMSPGQFWVPIAPGRLAGR